MNHQFEYALQLKKTIWRTSSARFNAARRFRRRQAFSTFSIAALSVLGIVLAIAQRIYALPVNSKLDNHYTFLAIAVGIFVLVLSLLEGSKAYLLKAEHLHKNAITLDTLQERLQSELAHALDGTPNSTTWIDEIIKEYKERINECTDNHDPIDDRLFLAQHRLSAEFVDNNNAPLISLFHSIVIQILYWLETIWLYALLWIGIGLLLVLFIIRLISQ
jgi:hypothetical protein